MYRIVAFFSAVLLLASAGAAQAYTIKVTNQTSQEDGVSIQGTYKGDLGLFGITKNMINPGESWQKSITGINVGVCFKEIKITPIQKLPGCTESTKDVIKKGTWCKNIEVKVKRSGCALAVDVERLVK